PGSLRGGDRTERQHAARRPALPPARGSAASRLHRPRTRQRLHTAVRRQEQSPAPLHRWHRRPPQHLPPHPPPPPPHPPPPLPPPRRDARPRSLEHAGNLP